MTLYRVAGRRVLTAAASMLAMALFTFSAGAQEVAPTMYDGPDRTARLIAGAKKEGTVTVYGSMAEKDLRRLVAEFEKRHGIKVNVWRSGKNRVLQRAVQEARANRFEVDVLHNPSPEMEAARRERLLQEVRSPLHQTLIAAAVPPHREWVALRMYIFVQAYNTNKVKREELPRTFRDLLDPRWKGRLAIEAKEQEWFYTMVREMGEQNGLKFFRDLVAANGLSVRNGNALLNNMVIAGEVPFAMTLYSYLPEQSKRAGAPIDWIALQPTVAYTDGLAVARRAPHPYAATLFYDFMFSEGLDMLAELNHVTVSRKNEAYLSKFQLKFVDLDAVLNDYDKWTKIFEDTIHGHGADAKIPAPVR